MAGSDRVVWSEGMFLRTQHFQQQDRWVEAYVQGALADLVGHGWGFRRLELNTGLLATGQIALASRRGAAARRHAVLASRTAPTIPAPLRTAETTRDGIVYLCLPALQPGAAEVDADGATGIRRPAARPGRRRSGTRSPAWTVAQTSRSPGRCSACATSATDCAGLVGMGVARIKGREADGSVALDADYIPPCLRSTSIRLPDFLAELEGKLESIAAARVGYILNPQARGSADVRDLLVLELINRARPQILHLREQGTLHPERLYQFLVGLAGEMATYAAGDRRPPAFPIYHHPEPGTAFLPLIKTIRQLLVGLAKIEGKAVPVPLHVHKSGIRTTEDTTPELFKESSFVLAVRAAVPHGAGAQPLPAAVRDRAGRGVPGPVHLAAARHRARGRCR